MAYLAGMVLGNGEVQRDKDTTTVTIDIPYKKLEDDEGKDVAIYVKASLFDISGIIKPLINGDLSVSHTKHSAKLTFTKRNGDYAISELMRFIGNGINHTSMTLNKELFNISTDEKKELLRGIADVT